MERTVKLYNDSETLVTYNNIRYRLIKVLNEAFREELPHQIDECNFAIEFRIRMNHHALQA